MNNKVLIAVGAAVLLALLALLAFLLWPSGGEADDAFEIETADGGKIKLDFGGDGMRTAMTSPADGYFALPPEERTAYLDKIIDEQARLLEDLDIDLSQIQAGGGGGGQIRLRGGTPEAPDDGGEQSFTFKGNLNPMSSLPAEDQARIAEFTKALADRRKERGIEGPMIITHSRTVTR